MLQQAFSYSNNGVIAFRRVVTRPKIREHSPNLNRGFRTLGVSRATRAKIAKHAHVLCNLSRRRTIRAASGKFIDHQVSFITLTLPAEQRHEDHYITREVLGTFLDKCRKLGFFENYLWRAEKQGNGNIHYHIMTDSYAPFSLFRRVWYVALRKYGYLQDYQRKFQNMSFEEYREQPFNANASPTTVAARYARGRRNDWQEPPCIDVEFVNGSSGVSRYVSKYVSKADDSGDLHVSGRCWGASQSVSMATKVFTTDPELSQFWYNAGAELMKRKVIAKDFFSYCLFNLHSLAAWFPDVRQYIKKLLQPHFQPCNYFLNYAPIL